ncbi:hypothetical protein [Hoyosella subflava]|uniref:Uncharacterized protein n=1 Tax=Hoyosella subflava (strain DSM 45089 / JCM 17490 / NBRC 109087 / DQS3-9A1) TaxID=443218 RepID=F6EHG6_HOYSD|nr:hypothetical protein [Hoyosella subflava]AEF41145.1 hypothetical protein AS9A_2698 [Hoyosella subflava DQS3-9A1]
MSPEPNHPSWRDPDGFDDHGSGYSGGADEHVFADDYQAPWDREYDDEPPRKTWRPLITWVLIGALMLGPLLTLLNFYRAEPVVVVVIIGVLIGVAYVAHARRGDAVTRIDRAFKKRDR